MVILNVDFWLDNILEEDSIAGLFWSGWIVNFVDFFLSFCYCGAQGIAISSVVNL